MPKRREAVGADDDGDIAGDAADDESASEIEQRAHRSGYVLAVVKITSLQDAANITRGARSHLYMYPVSPFPVSGHYYCNPGDRPTDRATGDQLVPHSRSVLVQWPSSEADKWPRRRQHKRAKRRRRGAAMDRGRFEKWSVFSGE